MQCLVLLKLVRWKKKHRIIPIEVKAAGNLKAKSLKSYHEKFNPEISIRTSLSDYRKEDWIVNLPLFGCMALFEEEV
jgi:hypothetical protein